MKRALIFLLMLPVLLTATTYSLDQLVEYGLTNSWTMRSADLTYSNALSQFRSSKWSLLPDVALNAGVTRDLSGKSAPLSSLSSNAGISINKVISLNDQEYFQYRYAKIDKDTALLQLEQSKQDYVYSVLSAYVEVLSAQRQLSSLNKNLEIQQRVWDQSKELLKLGKTTAFDVKQNEIAVMNSRISILKMKNTIETSRRELFSLVNLTDEGFDLDDLEANVQASSPSLDTEAVSDLILLHQQLKRNQLAEKQDFLDKFPRINLSYDFRRNVGGEDFDFDTYSTTHQLALTLSYPIWNFFTNKESSARTKANTRMTQFSLESKTDAVKKQYDQTITELNYLTQLDAMYEEKLSQSREQIRIGEERYRLGLIELLELDKIRTDYIEADIAYYANKYQILLKQEGLNKLAANKILGKW